MGPAQRSPTPTITIHRTGRLLAPSMPVSSRPCEVVRRSRHGACA